MLGLVPGVGPYLTVFIWGGTTVTGITLQRVFILHVLLPLVTIIIIALHISPLHLGGGSSNPSSFYEYSTPKGFRQSKPREFSYNPFLFQGYFWGRTKFRYF